MMAGLGMDILDTFVVVHADCFDAIACACVVVTRVVASFSLQ
jgi:hypothetical protein